jgi:oligosaccharide reducing-end xylanase
VEQNGLIPLEINVDGEPSPDVPYHDETSARALFNRWFISTWMGPTTWIRDQSRTLLDFFLAREEPLVSSYRLGGGRRGDRNTPAHVALTATAAAVADDVETYGLFLQTLVDEPIPEGDDRYYQGMLYLITFLAVSGSIEAGEP